MCSGDVGEMKGDIQLIREYLEGEERAVEELMERYKGLVNSISRAYFLKGVDRDDIVQEGMIGLFNAIVTYKLDGGISFITYAHECIKNRILDCIRKGTRLKNKVLSESVPISAMEDTDGGMMTPEEIAIRTEETDTIKNVISTSLSECEQVIFDMYYKGASYLQIAQALGKNTKYVDNTLQRIRKKIKANLPNSD